MAEPPNPPRCQVCKEGLVKPDIVFFGEGLPQRFFKVSLCALGGEEGLMHLALDYDRLDCSPYSIPLILLFNYLLLCYSLSLSCLSLSRENISTAPSVLVILCTSFHPLFVRV